MSKPLKLTLAIIAVVALLGLTVAAGSGGAWMMKQVRALHGH